MSGERAPGAVSSAPRQGIDPQAMEFLRRLAGPDAEQLDTETMLRRMQGRMRSFLLEYKFALDEVSTKVGILREQFDAAHEHSPIEHVKTRLKSVESLMAKIALRGVPADLTQIREQIFDIAGLRVTSPYVADVHLVADALRRQEDLTVLQEKDYIAAPKPNGYRSLHLIVRVPVFLAEKTVHVPVEIQLRTIAMDFWSSTEHSLRYKFDGDVPEQHSRRMSQIAETTRELDEQMAELRRVLAS
ncbi:GTP pyrophosphokinase [Brachybacterium endophyticum]|uniref:GTP pyrophosphokinase n=1 Tax=Brachybacterium endophyticum TaxID=2182385 RepID=A0A2U2RPG7_9MICO|nr:GTP pyrophosphokinase family protein [Brachybacterium endophyticum]PWH07750.1 GTP pyrophosphokinase [Brachybacterium endophyticum]